MRPEKFRYLMNQAFDHYLEKGCVSKFRPLVREMKRVREIQKKVEGIKSDNIQYDYMYSDNNMTYYSDRYRTYHRLNYIINGIENDLI